MDKNVIAIGYAIAAAAFYALNVPCSKMLLAHISPVFMAGLLYIGAGLGIGILYLFHVRCEPQSERLCKKDFPYTLGLVLLAIAAPILAESVTPQSSIRPKCTASIRGPAPCAPITAAPAAVAVHCAAGGRCPPYSSGIRNCFSATQKCDEVDATAVRTAPLSVSTDASASVSAIVEHAP